MVLSWESERNGQTPLSPDDMEGLKLTWVATIADRDIAEQNNITTARLAWLTRQASVDELLDDHTVRRLHADIAGQVWSWAGTYRRREVNLGIDPAQVPMAVRDLVANAIYWLQDDDQRTELARIHHRIVSIHPFPTVNGTAACGLT